MADQQSYSVLLLVAVGGEVVTKVLDEGLAVGEVIGVMKAHRPSLRLGSVVVERSDGERYSWNDVEGGLLERAAAAGRRAVAAFEEANRGRLAAPGIIPQVVRRPDHSAAPNPGWDSVFPAEPTFESAGAVVRAADALSAIPIQGPALSWGPATRAAVDSLCSGWIDQAPRFGAVRETFPESLRKRRFVAGFWAPEVLLFGPFYQRGWVREDIDEVCASLIRLAEKVPVSFSSGSSGLDSAFPALVPTFWSPELPEVEPQFGQSPGYHPTVRIGARETRIQLTEVPPRYQPFGPIV